MIDDVQKLVPLLVQAGAIKVGLFGSMARREDNDKSDIDLLVEFDRAKGPSLLGVVGLQMKLENIAGRKVDLVTKLNRHLIPFVDKDLILLYGKK